MVVQAALDQLLRGICLGRAGMDIPTVHSAFLVVLAGARFADRRAAIGGRSQQRPLPAAEPDEPIGPDEEVEVEGGRFVLSAINALPLRAIIGVVNIADCRRFEDLPKELRDDPFASEGCWCWVLEEPKPLDKPFPCKGKLQLWNPPDGFTLR